MAESKKPPGVEQPGADELVCGLRTDDWLDADKLASEVERRVVAEHHGRARERSSRRVEPGEPSASGTRDLRWGDVADPSGAGGIERHMLLPQRPRELR
jgi:hypothetical protein